jgi:hypothetical protein
MAFTDSEKLAYLRVNKKSSNMDVKPVDLLRAAVYALESGAEHYESLIILARTPLPGGGYGIDTWRCNFARDSETAMYVVAQDIHLTKMKEGR